MRVSVLALDADFQSVLNSTLRIATATHTCDGDTFVIRGAAAPSLPRFPTTP